MLNNQQKARKEEERDEKDIGIPFRKRPTERVSIISRHTAI